MATFKVGGASDLPTSSKDSWDGAAAKARVFTWAGGDDFDPAKARRAFALYDADATDLRGSYKLPYADVLDGTLTAIKGGVQAAKSRLRQTDAPEDVLDRAESLLNRYWDKMSGDEKGRPTPRGVQYRTAEIESGDDGAGFSGYASHFWSVDSYFTAVKPGAFRKTIKERGERMPILWQHDPDKPIGKPTALKEDKTGLRFDAAISEGTTTGRDAMTLLRDGVPLGMSFGFQTIKSRSATDDDPLDYGQYKADPAEIQVIEEVRLWEVSLVTFPANELATINDVRSVAEADALQSLIEHIRDGSLANDHAALVAELVAAFNERAEPEPSDTPLPDEIARRRTRDIEIAIALAHSRDWLGVTHA